MPIIIKDVCLSYDCLIRTCSRNRIQYSRRNRFQLNWVDFQTGCKMYKSKHQWKTYFTPPPREDDDLFYTNIEDEDE